jgi:hypothetical protein
MKRNQFQESFVTIKDVELDVMVEFQNVPPEPDVGEWGGIELLNVFHEDNGCVMGECTEEELNTLAIRIGLHMDDRGNEP